MKLKKDMQKEIQKYQGKIFYLKESVDQYGNCLTPTIEPAHWINSTADYCHCTFELHHVVPFTDWELNTGNVQEKVENALILIRKITHQHLENPEYKLSKKEFERVYGINPDVILFDINSKLPRTSELFTSRFQDNSFDYDGCFDSVASGVFCA